MTRETLIFSGPFSLRVEKSEIPEPGPGQVLVETRFSAVSSGTEKLLYSGLFPKSLSLDVSLPALSGPFRYPVSYGYSAVGRVAACGSGVNPEWLDRRVFSFHPHESHFVADPSELVVLPDALASLDALFIPSLETAVTLVMDGRPVIGETVAVLGEGVIGLLTTGLLSRFPLKTLVGVDPVALRRRMALEMGAHAAIPGVGEGSFLNANGRGADLVYELTGQPEALNDALALSGFATRIVVGSWYGERSAPVHLGGRFHRDRVRIVSSQVSTLSPFHSGRWDKGRRMETVLEWLVAIKPGRLITHRFGLEEADKAFGRLVDLPSETLQVVFEYPSREAALP